MNLRSKPVLLRKYTVFYLPFYRAVNCQLVCLFTIIFTLFISITLSAAPFQQAGSAQGMVSTEAGNYLSSTDACVAPDATGWPTSRDPITWPFASDSFWNTPIGCEAEYAPAGFGRLDTWDTDEDLLFIAKETDPLVELYAAGDPPYGPVTDRCSGTELLTSMRINFPADVVIPSRGHNYSTAILLADGENFLQLNAFARCTVGGAIFARPKRDPFDKLESIYGEGRSGGHSGSGLSSIGGTLRSGEATGDVPIRHALKINLRPQQMYFERGDVERSVTACRTELTSSERRFNGARWPALNNDSSACWNYASDNPELRIGALLAIPAGETATALGIVSEPGLIFFKAMQDYGLYVVDGSGPNPNRIRNSIAAHSEVLDEFEAHWGFPFEFRWYESTENQTAEHAAYIADIQRLIQALHVVSNNAADRVGGGGSTRRRPPAPDLTRTTTNQAPTAVNDTGATKQSVLVEIDLISNDLDIDGDKLSITMVDSASKNGSAIINNHDGTVSYTPASNFSGDDSFSYTVSDGNGGFDTGTVNVTVTSTATNQAPTAVNDTGTTEQNIPIEINLLGNDLDSDGDVLSITALDKTSIDEGTITDDGDGTVRYTPARNFSGNDRFNYTVSDGNGGFDTATVTVTVTSMVTPGEPGNNGGDNEGNENSNDDGGGGSFDLYALLIFLLGGVLRRIAQWRSYASRLISLMVRLRLVVSKSTVVNLSNLIANTTILVLTTSSIAMAQQADVRNYNSILFEETFESGAYSSKWKPDNETDPINGITVVNSPARAGNKAVRFRVDPTGSYPVRSELSTPTGAAKIGSVYWTGVSIYVPDDFDYTDSYASAVMQWRGITDKPPVCNPKEDNRSPVFSLSITRFGKWQVASRSNSERCAGGQKPASPHTIKKWDFPLIRGGWTDWVVQVKFSSFSDGFLNVWKNGVQIIQYKGSTAFNDSVGPFFKMGQYNWDWRNKEIRGKAVTRDLYHDELRIGNRNATYADVAPGDNSPPVNILPPSAPEPVPTPPSSVENYHYLEAEAASTVVAPYQETESSNASNGSYMVVPNGAGFNQGALKYSVDVPAGDYAIWARVLTPSQSDNSFNFAFDNETLNTQWISVYTDWTWVKLNPKKKFLSAGIHVLNFSSREDGTQIDKILLTTDLVFTPSGLGGATENIGAAPDTDNDGVLDTQDAFPADPVEWQDSDSDGIGNNADPDDDNDSLPDDWEIQYGLDPLNASDAASDLDGDTLSNLQEFNLNTNPTLTDTDGNGIDDNIDMTGDVSAYEVAVELPACDANNSEVQFIRTDEDWRMINDTSKRIFCVQPGNYTKLGLVSLSANGTSTFPRYLRYYNPENPTDTTHPANASETNRAVVVQLRLNGASWWIVDGLTFRTQATRGGAARGTVRIRANSDNNIFNRVLIENGREMFEIQDRSDFNVLQNSVIRNAHLRQDLDSHCAIIFNNIKGNRFVNNELYNCTDGIQFWKGTSEADIANWDIKETVIYNNDFYVTQAFLDTCFVPLNAGAGCIENAIDIKMTTDESTATMNRTLIKNNRMSGYPSGAVIMHHPYTRGIDIQDNIIFDSDGGVSLLKSGGGDITISNNLFYRIQLDANRVTVPPWYSSGRVFWFEGSFNDVKAFDNTVVDAGLYLYGGSKISNYQSQNNVFIDAGTWKERNGDLQASSSVGSNAYYNTATYSGTASTGNNLIFPSAADAEHRQYCFPIRQHTDPTKQFCIPNAVATEQSPHKFGYKPISVTTVTNQAPTTVDDTSTTEQGVATEIDLLSNDFDSDGDELSISMIDSASENGGAIINNRDGIVSYTPASNFSGNDRFNYTVSDGNGGFDTGTVNVTVTVTSTVAPDALDNNGDGNGSDENGNDDGGGGSLDLYAMLILLLGGVLRWIVRWRASQSVCAWKAFSQPVNDQSLRNS